MDIKTTADNGIIFYASGLNNANLIAVYVLDGKVTMKHFYLHSKTVPISILKNNSLRFITYLIAEAVRRYWKAIKKSTTTSGT